MTFAQLELAEKNSPENFWAGSFCDRSVLSFGRVVRPCYDF